MDRAQKRDAVNQQKFYFRKNVLPPGRNIDSLYTKSGTCHCGCNGSSNTDVSALGDVNDSVPSSPCSEQSLPSYKDKVLRNCFPDVEPPSTLERPPIETEYEEMSINEIINGKVRFFSIKRSVILIIRSIVQDQFPGLLGVVNTYLNSLDVETHVKDRIHNYLNLIKSRSDGENFFL